MLLSFTLTIPQHTRHAPRRHINAAMLLPLDDMARAMPRARHKAALRRASAISDSVDASASQQHVTTLHVHNGTVD